MLPDWKKVLILGDGVSGRAARRLLDSIGVPGFFLTDATEDPQLLLDSGADAAVISPGFPWNHEWLEKLRVAGVELVPEFELGWRYAGKPVVAVTGSNGKSTAVKWIAEALELSGLRPALCGNYGIPVCAAVLDRPDADWLVMELSSFQLEAAVHFRAEAGAVLNLLPNHLDRHGSMERYAGCKMNLFRQACGTDLAVLPAGSALRAETVRTLRFGRESADFIYRDGLVYSETEPALDVRGTYFENEVLGPCTVAAAAAVFSGLNLSLKPLEEAARRFEPLPHRLQTVAEFDGIRFVNDSKATNLAALQSAVLTQRGPVRLIAGGRAKETDFNSVKEVLAQRVKKIYLIGQVSSAMYAAWKEACACEECGTLDQAVLRAVQEGGNGETVLFSPGCASFDQFRNYMERGDFFTECVRALQVRDKVV